MKFDITDHSHRHFTSLLDRAAGTPPPGADHPFAQSARLSQRCLPLILGALSLSLLAGITNHALAAETTVQSAAGPAIVDWPGNHYAMFTITQRDHFYTSFYDATCISAYVGTKPNTTDAAPQSPNWTWQTTHDFGFRLKDRLQVVPQPCNKTLIFANDNNQNIWCYTMKASADGSQVLDQGDTVEPIRIDGGFDSYCIIPLPFKTPAPFINDPTVDDELYPMLLVYLQNNTVHCERLDFAWNNSSYDWVLNRSQQSSGGADLGPLFSVLSQEKKLSACLVPSRDPNNAKSYPYKLIVTTVKPRGNTTQGTLIAREAYLDANGYQNPDSNANAQNVNAQTIGAGDGRYVRTTEDVIAYVGADGRPAVNSLDTNMQPIHYICDQSQPLGYQWQWDTSYGVWWDCGYYRWTPTTHYYTSWSASDQQVNTVTVAGLTTTSSQDDSQNTSGPYGDDHEIVRPVFRYALGEGQNSNYLRFMREKLFNAHLKPRQFIGKDSKDQNNRYLMKSLLLGVIEGPPPVPWQNIKLATSLAAGDTFSSTQITLATSAGNDMTTQTSTGLVAKTSGAVGVAWDLSAATAFQQFGSTSAQSVTANTMYCDLTLNAPSGGALTPIAPHDIAETGAAVLLKQDYEVYDWTITWNSNDQPVSGSTTYQQVALKNPTISVVNYYMNRACGIVDNQPVYPGRLSSYHRNAGSPISSYPMYTGQTGGSSSFSVLNTSWSDSSGVEPMESHTYSSTTGTGTSFDLQAMIGAGNSNASALVGFQASGSWTCSTTNTQSASILSGLGTGVPGVTHNLASNTTTPHIFTQYDYATYWLKESPAWMANFKRVLQYGYLPPDLGSHNKELLEQISPQSAPWVVTYGLSNVPTWNAGPRDGSQDIFSLMLNDDLN